MMGDLSEVAYMAMYAGFAREGWLGLGWSGAAYYDEKERRLYHADLAVLPLPEVPVYPGFYPTGRLGGDSP